MLVIIIFLNMEDIPNEITRCKRRLELAQVSAF